MLASCELCEHRCRVDRSRPEPPAERTPCALGAESRVFKRHVSFAEEIELLPSYMVYFAGCNLRCRWCVQGPTCFAPTAGAVVDPRALASECSRVVARGAKTINLLGGEPSIHLHTLLELAAEAPSDAPLPLALNSNMYMTEEVLDLLDGLVGIYVADHKFGNDACAERLSGAIRYTAVVQRNLLIAARQAPIIVRHLLMPGHLACCLEPVARWVADHLPEATFSLMTSYVPAWKAAHDPGPLGGTSHPDEVSQAEALVRSLGLRREGVP
ncbi:MAG: radical SAM protein [Phycisphaerae bacterium]|nr:radical SAM protein [Phycisphaerae bacterium]